jgi:ATP-dependent helicase/DNAse subunit B
VIAHYRNIANHTSKNILQGHVSNNPCDWKPSLGCRSEGINLDVPE